jgi:hypothetical protein
MISPAFSNRLKQTGARRKPRADLTLEQVQRSFVALVERVFSGAPRESK